MSAAMGFHHSQAILILLTTVLLFGALHASPSSSHAPITRDSMAPGNQRGWRKDLYSDLDGESGGGDLSLMLPVGDPLDPTPKRAFHYEKDSSVCDIGALEDMFTSWPETGHLIVPMLVPCLPAIVHPALASFPWELSGEDEWTRVRKIVRESREAGMGVPTMDYDALAALEGQSQVTSAEKMDRVGGYSKSVSASSQFSSLKQLLQLRKHILDVARDRARKQSRDDFRVSHDAQISILAWGVGICVGAMLAIFLSK